MGGASAAGMGLNLVGAALKGVSEQSALEARAQADRANQTIAQQQAADALQRGAFQAGALRMKASRTIASQRVAFGASGLDSNSGSAAAVQASSRAISEMDVSTAQLNARRQAWGFQMESTQYGHEADLAENAKGEALVGSALGGLGMVGAGAGRLIAAARPNVVDQEY